MSNQYKLLIRNSTSNKEWEFELENQLEDSKFYKFQITIPDDMIPSEYQYFLYEDDQLVNQGLMQIKEKEKIDSYDYINTNIIYES